MQEANVSEQENEQAGAQAGAGLNLDLDALTIGDLEDFQAAAGRNLLDVVTSEEGAAGDVKVLKAVLWIAKRQRDPSVTLEDVRDVKVVDLMAAQAATVAAAADADGEGEGSDPS